MRRNQMLRARAGVRLFAEILLVCAGVLIPTAAVLLAIFLAFGVV